MFNSRATLVELSIHLWTARKYDRGVSQTIDQTYSAQDGGRFNKHLLKVGALAPVTQAAAALRRYHYDSTLPWGDNGQRLLPAESLFAYREEVRKLRDVFNAKVNDFVTNYTAHVDEAKASLGQLFRASEYPTALQVRKQFDVGLTFLPVPEAGDFRVDAADEMREELRTEFAAAEAVRAQQAVDNLRERVENVLTRLRDQCAGKIISSAVVRDVNALPATVRALNLTDNPALTHAATVIEQELGLDEHAMRASLTYRKVIHDRASKILAELS